MKVNPRLIWDYHFEPKDYESEPFRRWYIGRVLCRGSMADVRDVGLTMVYRYLPSLALPTAIRELWDWYFSLPEVRPRYEHLDRKPDEGFAHGIPSPFVRR